MMRLGLLGDTPEIPMGVAFSMATRIPASWIPDWCGVTHHRQRAGNVRFFCEYRLTVQVSSGR
jgi:hypothetical protein